jgi:hypothetical protein
MVSSFMLFSVSVSLLLFGILDGRFAGFTQVHFS